ncbi:uroporphyrinogen-III synthase [Novosphingobium soli]|uniref:Uroporphyrinogen-III synthase n=1 Tax=Novosphingobium soli TaxID=574956 RepID=A0ABV6D188_9SPHN
MSEAPARVPLRVLVLRPEPGAAATHAAARARGLRAEAFPLFAVRPLAWQPVPPGDVDALLLGSANALRHGGAALAAYRGLPAYAVGETTALAARAAGLEVVAAGAGGLQTLVEGLAPRHRRLLRLAGRERVALTVPPGVSVTTREVYASEPLAPSPGLLAALSGPALALLHSGEAAARFAQVCEAAAIDRSQVALAAIGPRVAARAGTGWAALRCAAAPHDAALLALAVEMCQEAAPGQ